MIWYLPVDNFITNFSLKREKLHRNLTTYCIPRFHSDLRYMFASWEKVRFLSLKVIVEEIRGSKHSGAVASQQKQ